MDLTTRSLFKIDSKFCYVIIVSRLVLLWCSHFSNLKKYIRFAFPIYSAHIYLRILLKKLFKFSRLMFVNKIPQSASARGTLTLILVLKRSQSRRSDTFTTHQAKFLLLEGSNNLIISHLVALRIA